MGLMGLITDLSIIFWHHWGSAYPSLEVCLWVGFPVLPSLPSGRTKSPPQISAATAEWFMIFRGRQPFSRRNLRPAMTPGPSKAWARGDIGAITAIRAITESGWSGWRVGSCLLLGFAQVLAFWLTFFFFFFSFFFKVRVKGKSESRPRVWFRGHWSDRRRLLQVIREKPFRLCSILKVLGEMDLQNSENGFIDFNCETRSNMFFFNLKQELCPGIKAGALRAWRQSWRRWSEKPSRSPRASCRRRRWQPLQWIFWISD